MNQTDPQAEPEIANTLTEGNGSGPATTKLSGTDYASDRDFSDFPISAEIIKGLDEMGYRTATPVQAATIEPGLAGRDLLVRAKTGTGKTAAFCVPIAERIPDGDRVVRAMVLAPTRELAQQIADECQRIAKYRDLTVALLVGGVPMGPQEHALEEGPAIVVGTPGRVLDHLRRKNLDLSQVWATCLDEADEMLSMGFYEDVTTLLDATPASRQVLLFSATVSEQTGHLVERYLKEPEHIMLSTDWDQVSAIEHVLYESPTGQHKIRSLLYLLDLEDPTSAIIFCNTREDAATVASFLDRQGLDAQLLSGELPQSRRTRVMQQVKRGEVRFLVATDVAARGIDISDLSHVIQYSLPQDPALYLHRTGRTGRIGKKGTAISIVSASDLQTKRVLETQHGIRFVEKAFPDAEACVARRVERQATQIRDAMGSMVFEAYLPTARALMQREDGEALVAAALRAFFQWDRTRRATMSLGEVEGAEGALEREALVERPRRPRPARPMREARKRHEGAPREERRPKRGRERRESRPKLEEADLDALLVEMDESPVAAVDLVLVEEVSAKPGETDEAASGERKKRRRRRHKKKGGEGESSKESLAGEPLDALLEEGTVGPTESAPELDDLEALLSMD